MIIWLCIGAFVSIVAIFTTVFVWGYNVGVRQTEERWSDAVARTKGLM